MSEVVWQEPPPAHARTGKDDGPTQRLVRELQENPGRWAFYKTLKNRSLSEYKKLYPGTEWTARRGADGAGWDVYVRWVGVS